MAFGISTLDSVRSEVPKPEEYFYATDEAAGRLGLSKWYVRRIFFAPKSVSVAWAVADDDLRRKIQQCHDQAVSRTFEFLQNKVLFSIAGKGGKEFVKADMVAVTFQHMDIAVADDSATDIKSSPKTPFSSESDDSSS